MCSFWGGIERQGIWGCELDNIIPLNEEFLLSFARVSFISACSGALFCHVASKGRSEKSLVLGNRTNCEVKNGDFVSQEVSTDILNAE